MDLPFDWKVGQLLGGQVVGSCHSINEDNISNVVETLPLVESWNSIV